MTEALESIMLRIQQLSEARQSALAPVLEDVLAEVESLPALHEDLKDPAYRSYITDAVSASEAAVAEDDMLTASDLRNRSEARLRKLYGSV